MMSAVTAKARPTGFRAAVQRRKVLAGTAIFTLVTGIGAAVWTLAEATGRSADIWGANIATTLLGTGVTIVAVDLIAEHQSVAAAERAKQPLRDRYELQVTNFGRLLGTLLDWMMIDAWDEQGIRWDS